MGLIDIDIIKKKRGEGAGTAHGGTGSSSLGRSADYASEAGHADKAGHADDADRANRADEATHAASAKELDGGSSVWNTIRTWINNAKEGLGDLFLRRDRDDTTEHKLTMKEAEVKGALTVGGDATISGKVVTDDIHSSDSDGSTSMTGKGWTLRNVRDETGSYSVLAVDNIVVRKKMEAAELEIHRKTYVGAQQIASDWGHKILRVDPVNMDYETGEVSSISGLTLFTLPVTVDGVERPVAFVGRALSDTETRVELLGDGKGMLNQELETAANAFKVYFCESDGTASIEDDLVVGSMGQCQEFNVKERVTHNFKNTYYWGVCVKHGVEDNVMIGGKATKCVYGVFAHTTKLITLTSEVSKKTFTCYGMEMDDCTFPVAGDDMVGFGCADPWQDADRCNAIVTASKDGEKSAPGVIAYSGIGRKRGGAIVGELGADAACPAYAGIGEQYSIPSAKDDSRLDFRVSKRAGNVFKGELYFRGDDGTLQPIGATYMLSTDKSVVENGGSLTISVYKVVAGKAELISAADVTKAGLKLSITRSEGTTADVTSAYPTISWSTLSNNHSDVKNVVINLLKDDKILDTTSVSLGEKAVAQTEEWRLIPVMEKAAIDYDIDKAQYSNYAENGKTSDETLLDKVFKKTGNISLQYNILHRKSNVMQIFNSISGTITDYSLAVTEFNANDATVASYSSKDNNVGATNLRNSLMFSDSSSSAASVSHITVMLYDNNDVVIDRREVRMNLGTDGVYEMNKKFLAYIYYGTDGTKGTQYINRHVSTMEGNYTDLTKRVEGAEGNIKTNTQKITETAEEYKRELEQEKKDREEGDQDLKTSIEATAAGIKTTVKSLYKEGNLLWGANVMGMFRKMFRVYTSETITVKAGITYTLTVKAWMRANANDSQKPFYTDHAMRITLHGTKLMDNRTGKVLESGSLDRDKVNTPAIGYINRIVFTATEDTGVYVTINEIGSDANNPNPGAGNYGGVYVDWLRIDAGDHDTADKYTVWEPAAEDIETMNLVPDPEFKEDVKMSSLGATREYTDGDVSYMSKYGDDYSALGCYGIRMKRSGATKTSYDGIRYYVPFRGAGEYTLSAFFKEIGTVENDSDNLITVQIHKCDQDKNRILVGFDSIDFYPSSSAPGYEQLSKTFTVNDVYGGKAVCWFELRIYMTNNGDVVVNRISLAKCKHRIVYDSNSLSDENGRKIASESYAYQRADSMGAGIRQGLQSVGFKMDTANWTVNTWGDRFAWYATEADANAGTKAKMWLDTKTNTLHVKGDIETTGGSISFFTYDASGLRTPYIESDDKKFNGVGISISNISVSGNTNNRISSVYLGNGTIDSRWSNSNDMITYRAGSTSLGSTFCNYIKLEKINDLHNSFENDPEHAALGVETQGDVCITALGGASYFQALAFATASVFSDTTADGKHTIYLCSSGNFTMPKDPTDGLLIIVIQTAAGRIYFDGNGKRFRIGSNISDPGVKAISNVNGQWSFFIYSGSYWYCNFIEPGNGMW